jgi:hypothetical protein
MKHFLTSLALGAMILAPMAASAQGTVTVTDGDLIKASGATVYYLYNGKRLIFPTDKTYFSWYKDFSTVKTISDAQLTSYPLLANVTYKPGVRLVKITTDPKTYAVDAGGTLRWVQNEAVAKLMFGNDWAKQIDDLPDPFFINYKIGQPIVSPTDFNPNTSRDAATAIWKDKGYAAPGSQNPAPSGSGLY